MDFASRTAVTDAQESRSAWIRFIIWCGIATACFLVLRVHSVSAHVLDALGSLRSVVAWSPCWVPLWAFVCVVCLAFSIESVAYLDANTCLLPEGRQALTTLSGVLFCILMIPCVIICWWCRRRRFDRWHLMRGTCVLAAAFAFLTYLHHDVPRQEAPYSWADVPTPPADCMASTSALMKLCYSVDSSNQVHLFVPPELQSIIWKDIPSESIGASLTSAIAAAWASNSQYRSVIEELDHYSALPSVCRSYFGPLLQMGDMRMAARLYRLYSIKCAFDGDPTCGSTNIAVFFSVARKLMPFANNILCKQHAALCINDLVSAAFFVAQRKETTNDTLRMLRASLPPLRPEEIAMKPLVVGGALMGEEYYGMEQLIVSEALPYNCRWLTNIVRGAGLNHCIYNVNATLRRHRMYVAVTLDGAAQVPVMSPDLCDENVLLQSSLSLKNAGARNAAGFYGYLPTAINKCKVRTDLLAIYLGNRLGEPVKLKDYFSGGEYLVDKQTGLPYSVGPDGIPHTEDDIRL